MTPKCILNEYNNNYGFCKNKNLPLLLQKFIKYTNKECNNFNKFFNIINATYPNDNEFNKWLINCLKESEIRGYHDAREYGIYEDRFDVFKNRMENEYKKNTESDPSNKLDATMKKNMENEIMSVMNKEKTKYTNKGMRMPFSVKMKIKQEIKAKYLKMAKNGNQSNNNNNDGSNNNNNSNDNNSGNDENKSDSNENNDNNNNTNNNNDTNDNGMGETERMNDEIATALESERAKYKSENKKMPFCVKMRIQRQIMKKYEK